MPLRYGVSHWPITKKNIKIRGSCNIFVVIMMNLLRVNVVPSVFIDSLEHVFLAQLSKLSYPIATLSTPNRLEIK